MDGKGEDEKGKEEERGVTWGKESKGGVKWMKEVEEELEGTKY